VRGVCQPCFGKDQRGLHGEEWSGLVWEGEVGRMCRRKRDEERIAREMAEKEEEEARAVLEQAAKSGKIKLPTTGDKLDKEAILNQVAPTSRPADHPLPESIRKVERTPHPCSLPFPICCHNLWQRGGTRVTVHIRSSYCHEQWPKALYPRQPVIVDRCLG